MDYEGRSPKSQMRAANRSGAPVCLLLGPDELARGEVTVKDMTQGEQRTVARDQAVEQVAAICRVGGPLGPEGRSER